MPKELSHTAKLNTTPGSCVDCPLPTLRRVSYVFETGLWDDASDSEKSLTIPYAHAINGKIDAAYAKQAFLLHARQAKEFFVEPGQSISLYLNSDAKPGYRQIPVFKITPDAHDVEVIIKEKRGKLGDKETLDAPIETKEVTAKNGSKRKVDVYHTVLSGDIWLKVSHKYTTDEAKALIAPETAPEIRDAVLKLYDGSQQGKMQVSLKDAQGENKSLSVEFGDQSNPRDNTTAFDLYKDGLPRVHPQAWAAVIGAGFKAGVKGVKTSSAWRPQEGSILHRTGLGLDVNYLDNTQLNRGELINKGPDTDNVSEEEKRLYKEKRSADEAETQAQDEVNKLKAEQEALKARKAKEPNKVSPIREMEIEKELKIASEKKKDAAAKKEKANEAWNTERDKHEPVKVKDFRAALKHQKGVSNLFDPWFMNADVRHKPDLPNEYKTGNEKLHRHHLHITIDDPALPFK